MFPVSAFTLHGLRKKVLVSRQGPVTLNLVTVTVRQGMGSRAVLNEGGCVCSPRGRPWGGAGR